MAHFLNLIQIIKNLLRHYSEVLVDSNLNLSQSYKVAAQTTNVTQGCTYRVNPLLCS